MSVRYGTLTCKESGCYTPVAIGKISDSRYVWEIERHPSVIDTSGLWNGMGVGDFYSAHIEHRVDGDKVEHSIVSCRQATA